VEKKGGEDKPWRGGIMLGQVNLPWTIRTRLFLLLLVIFLPASALVIVSSLDDREDRINAASNNALLLVQSLTAQQERIAIGTELMLSTLAQLPEVQKLDANACNEVFRELNKRHPYYSTILAATTDGNMSASSIPFTPHVNLTDRKYIKDVIKTLDFSTGEYTLGKVTNVQSIHYAYPVFDQNKNFIAIVIAAFKLDEYSRFMKKANLPEGFVLNIVDHAGVRLYRRPEDQPIGPGVPIPRDLLETVSGNLEQGTLERVGEDGIRRLYAFKQLRLRENARPYLYMIVGIPKDKIVRKANLEMLRNLLFLGIAAGSGLALAWAFGHLVFVKPIGSLTAAAQLIGRSDMVVRTGLPHTSDDLGQLAKSFDDMAVLLELKRIESRNAEDALRKSEEKYRALIETTGTGYCITDREGRILDANSEYVRLSGHGTVQEILGRNVAEWTAPYDQERNAEEIRKCARGSFTRNQEIDYVNGDGRTIPVEINSSVVQTAEGPVILALCRDISDRKRMERKLRESESTARTLLDAPSQAVVLLDTRGIILDLNETTAQRNHKKKDELYGVCFWDLFSPTLAEQRKAIFEKVVQSGEPIRHVDKEELIWVENTVYPVLEADGKVSKVAAISYDISDRKLAEAERERLMADLDRSRSELEDRVEERTTQLVIANKRLKQEIEERKRVEEALRTVSQQWQATFDAVEDVIWLLGPDHKIIRSNKAAMNLLMKDPSEILGQHCCTVVHGTLFPMPECPVSHMKETGCRASMEFPMGERWFCVSVDPVMDETGRVQNMVHIMRDITEQKRAAEQLQQSEEKYRGIFEHSTLGIFQSDRQKRFISANRSLASVLGYESPQDLMASVHCIPDQVYVRPEVCGEIKRALAESDWATLEVEFRRRDLTTGTANLHIRVVRAEDGRALYMEGFSEDITERKRAEKQLRESKGMLQTIFDGISDPLIMVDQDGLVRMLNKAAKEYFHLSDYKDALGKRCFEAFFGRSAPCEECGPLSAMKGYVGTFERKGQMDHDRLEQVVVYSVEDESGKKKAAIVRISDITRTKILERQLIQNEKLASLGLLVSGIAHEINNPNSFIAFNIPILRDYVEALMPIIDIHAESRQNFELFGMSYQEFREDILKLLENMEHGSSRINATVSGLKEFARKREKTERSLVDIRQVVEKSVALCRSEIKKRVRSFEVMVPQQIPPILTHPEALEQVLVNLLINAVHASGKEDSWIKVNVMPAERHLCHCTIEVRDNGCGMDEETKKRIFDPLFTTKPATSGTGLGLYICHSLIEEIGGKIEVESELGRGSTFRIVLYNMVSV